MDKYKIDDFRVLEYRITNLEICSLESKIFTSVFGVLSIKKVKKTI